MTSTAARKTDTGGPHDPGPVLNVECSLAGKRWRRRGGDERQGLMLAQRLGLPEVVGRVLAARGVAADQAADFMAPTLKALLPDPSTLKDMDAAAARLVRAIQAGETIAVFADYDVDGGTAAALLHRFLAAVDRPPLVYVPDRLGEGYGPNAEAMARLRAEGADVVVTVDCGATAHEPLAAAAAAGLDVIVCDHHAGEPALPPAVAVVNPNRMDEAGGLGQLAAVGVAFLLVVALNRALRAAGHYRDRPEPDPRDWLDLVALGTVCDVVPLTGINRALVAQGLKVMARRANTGLRALADTARLDAAPTAYHAGFVLGPRINAGGRIGEPGLGVRLLTTEDGAEAAALAARLDALNRERQDLEAAVLAAALDQAEAAPELGAAVVVAADGWHAGVVGIVASRLAERFNRPACVVALDGDTGTGSGRSVPGVDLGAAIIAARQAGHLQRGGGHPMAAGFTLARDRLEAFRAFVDERIGRRVAEASVVPTLGLDGALSLGAGNMALIRTLQRLAPFGPGNPEPCFAFAGVGLGYVERVGDNHLRCRLTDAAGASLKGIAFRVADTEMGRAFLRHDGAPFHVAGRLRINAWQDRETAELLIDDAAPAW